MRDVPDLLWSWLAAKSPTPPVEHGEFFAQPQGHKLIRVVRRLGHLPVEGKSLSWDPCRTRA